MSSVQGVEGMLALVAAAARQWFGALLLPRGPEDAWLLEGCVGLLVEHFTLAHLGKNELAYRQGGPRYWQSAVRAGREPAQACIGAGGQ